MDMFDNNILAILDKFSYPFFIVQQNSAVRCQCVDITTLLANPACPICLGTGYQITIQKIQGASNSKMANFVNSGPIESSSTDVFYIRQNWPLEEDNVIVDGNKVLDVYRVQPETSTNGNIIYQKVLVMLKRANDKIFLTNFNKIVGA